MQRKPLILMQRLARQSEKKVDMMNVDLQHVPPQTGKRMSIKEYLSLEERFPMRKYEYHHGTVRLLSGGSHTTITSNIFMGLCVQFRSGPCTVYTSDMRVQVAEGTCYLPDVLVTCNVDDRRRGVTLVRSPRLVIEVLSPSTEKTDRTEKLKMYQACPTIAEIVLVSQFSPYVELWRRDEETPGTWRYAHYEIGEKVEFTSVDVCLSMEEIYEGTMLDEAFVDA
ncbi:MAG: Uma2 family endonuclease [Chloroflexota bacterium]|nr:Uma2 family endonuclease [Chloroflexota bacterium]